MARPKNTIPTIAKTISVNQADEEYIVGKDIQFKHIIALGVSAHRAGWNSHKDSKEIQALQDRISKISLVLGDYTQKFDRLCQIVEKGLSMKINADLSNIDELQKKIDDVYYNEDDIKKPKNKRN